MFAGLYTGGLSTAALPALWAAADVTVGWMEAEFGTSPIEYLVCESGKNVTVVTLDMLADPKDGILRSWAGSSRPRGSASRWRCSTP